MRKPLATSATETSLVRQGLLKPQSHRTLLPISFLQDKLLNPLTCTHLTRVHISLGIDG